MYLKRLYSHPRALKIPAEGLVVPLSAKPPDEEKMANTRSKALHEEIDGNPVYFVEIMGQTFRVKKKFKRLKFLRLLTKDPAEALSLVFYDDDEMARLEELDMDENDLAQVIEAVSEVLTGDRKN